MDGFDGTIQFGILGFVFTRRQNESRSLGGNSKCVRHQIDGGCVNEHKVILIRLCLDKVNHIGGAEQFSRTRRRGTGGEEVHAGTHITDHRILKGIKAHQHARKTVLVAHLEILVNGGVAQIGVNQKHLGADLRHTDCQIDGTGGFEIIGGGTGDDKDAVFHRREGKENIGADQVVG